MAIAQLLIKEGADVRGLVRRRYLGPQRMDARPVKLLLESGTVEVDSRDDTGRTPLLYAAKGGHETVVKLLLEGRR